MLLRVKKPAALVLLLTMTACTSLQPVAEPSGYVAQKSPSFVVVTTVEQEDQGPMVVSGPRVEGGNLVGMLEGEQASIPMTTIRTIQAVQPDKRKTMFAIIGAVALTGAITYISFMRGSKIDNSPVCVPGGHRGDLPYCSGYDGARIP